MSFLIKTHNFLKEHEKEKQKRGVNFNLFQCKHLKLKEKSIQQVGQ